MSFLIFFLNLTSSFAVQNYERPKCPVICLQNYLQWKKPTIVSLWARVGKHSTGIRVIEACPVQQQKRISETDMWVNFFIATVLILIRKKKSEMKKQIYALAARYLWIDQLTLGQKTVRHRSFVCSVRKRIAGLRGAAVCSSFWELGCSQYFTSSHSTWDVLWFRSNQPPSALLVFKSISNCSTRIAPALQRRDTVWEALATSERIT